jgi:hypothetical protein
VCEPAHAECYNNFMGADSLREAIAALLQRTFMAGMQVWPCASPSPLSLHDPDAMSPRHAMERTLGVDTKRPSCGAWTGGFTLPYTS